jgi:hypothetical protein
MDQIIQTLEDLHKTQDPLKYILVIKLVNSGYCNILVENLKTRQDSDSKNIIIKLMTELSTFDIGRKEFVKSGLCVFICDILKTEIVEQYILDIALLIGNLGLADIQRPILFNQGISHILINILSNLTQIDSKILILKVIKMLCQTKLETNEFIQLGILNHLLETLPKVDTEKLKGDLTSQIYWISYLSNNKDIINNTDCIDIMYKVAESITNKSLQSQIFVYIHYFIKHKPENINYSLYNFWKNNFKEYLKL